MILTEWNGKKISNGSAFFRNYKLITSHSFNQDYSNINNADVGELIVDMYVAMRRTAEPELEKTGYASIADEIGVNEIFDPDAKLYRKLIETLLEKKVSVNPEAEKTADKK
jgi:hypothetical protein